MLNIETTYAREIDGKYEIFSSYSSADEIELNAPIVEYQKSHFGTYYYLFLFDDYQSYIYELANLCHNKEDY